MDGLIENAQGLLEMAAQAAVAGPEAGEWTVFVGPEGGLRMIAGRECDPASLAWTHGASRAWRISRKGSMVRVEGVMGPHRCLLESPAPNALPHRLLADLRLYALAG
jgi:hypothetical protein